MADGHGLGPSYLLCAVRKMVRPSGCKAYESMTSLVNGHGEGTLCQRQSMVGLGAHGSSFSVGANDMAWKKSCCVFWTKHGNAYSASVVATHLW